MKRLVNYAHLPALDIIDSDLRFLVNDSFLYTVFYSLISDWDADLTEAELL